MNLSEYGVMMNQTYDKQKKHTTKNGKYFISTNNTFDHGWETMVFMRNPLNGKIDFTELDSGRYDNQEQAYKGHEQMINKWEAKA